MQNGFSLFVIDIHPFQYGIMEAVGQRLFNFYKIQLNLNTRRLFYIRHPRSVISYSSFLLFPNPDFLPLGFFVSLLVLGAAGMGIFPAVVFAEAFFDHDDAEVATVF